MFLLALVIGCIHTIIFCIGNPAGASRLIGFVITIKGWHERSSHTHPISFRKNIREVYHNHNLYGVSNLFFFFWERFFQFKFFLFGSIYTCRWSVSSRPNRAAILKKRNLFFYTFSSGWGKNIKKREKFPTFPPLHPDLCIREHVTDGYRNHVWRHHVYLLEEKKSDDSPAYWTDMARRWVDRVSGWTHRHEQQRLTFTFYVLLVWL